MIADIEFRWVKPIKLDGENQSEKVTLQLRTMSVKQCLKMVEDKVLGQCFYMDNEKEWSNWQDVPVVEE